ncbi:MAG: sigma-70 family RNA polymerase sigma factor [Pirellula sp.]
MNRINDQQLEQIVSRHGAALVLYARQWCNLPDDAVQEALCELVQAPEIPMDVVPWLFKAVRFRALNIARSERRRDSHQRAASQLRDAWFTCRTETNLEAAELQIFLSKLPEMEREIVVARVWGELTFEQIAELTDMASSTVHRFYTRSMSRLKVLLDNQMETRS